MLTLSSVGEQHAVLRSFVREIVRGENKATVYYTLPMPPSRDSTDKYPVMNTDSFGGAVGRQWVAWARNAEPAYSGMHFEETPRNLNATGAPVKNKD